VVRVGDNHLHLNPVKGMGVREFAERFLASGGWFAGLVNLTSWSYGVKIAGAEDYEMVYRLTLDAPRRRGGPLPPQYRICGRPPPLEIPTQPPPPSFTHPPPPHGLRPAPPAHLDKYHTAHRG